MKSFLRSCDFSFLSDWVSAGLHRFDKIRCRGPFERESVTYFSHDALLQRLNEVRARVAAGDFRSFQQERLCSSWPGPVTPGGEDSVTRHNAASEVRQIVERCTFPRHNHVGEQRILGMYMGTSFDRRDHRHAN